jgi:hypothetical protein
MKKSLAWDSVWLVSMKLLFFVSLPNQTKSVELNYEKIIRKR